MEVPPRHPLQDSPVKVFMDLEVEIRPFADGTAMRLLAGLPQATFRPEKVKVTELTGKPAIALNGRYVQLDEFPEFFLCRDYKDEVLGERYYCSQSHTVQVGDLLSFQLFNQTKELCKFKIRVEGTAIGTQPGRVGYFQLWIPEAEVTATLADMVMKKLDEA